MNIEKTIRNLKSRGFAACSFSSADEAVEYIASAVSGTVVGIGGSKTVEAIGLYDRLSQNNTVYWHWKVPGEATLNAANAAPVYISSANAVSEDGEILNIDGTGNRISAESYGNKKLYIVIGTNKIAPDFASALDRARNVAAVRNAERFKRNIPCTIDGKCHDCRSPERICRGLLVLWSPMSGMEVEVIIIDEELGF